MSNIFVSTLVKFVKWLVHFAAVMFLISCWFLLASGPFYADGIAFNWNLPLFIFSLFWGGYWFAFLVMNEKFMRFLLLDFDDE